MRKLYRSLLAVGAVTGVVACGDDVTVQQPPEQPPPTVTAVTVQGPATLRVGESAVFSASVTTNGPGVNTAVTWSSANAAIASVNATGTVTGVAPGSTTIRATSVANSGVSGAAAVTVVPAVVRSVSVAPTSATLVVGQTLTATATVDRDPGVAGTVTWSSNNSAVASVGSTTGVITAVAVGSAVITATSTADTSKKGTLSVTVVPQPVVLSSLSVTPGSVNLGPGATQGLTTIHGVAATCSSPTVTYANSSSNPAVATVTATGANPTITAVGNGTAVITVTATGSCAGHQTNSISATVTVNVQAASVSIASVTQGGLPVNLANVFGQIEVTVNIDPGFQTLDSVRVRLGGTSAAAQSFTVSGAPSAPVTLSINTAAYTVDVAAGTSTVRFPNGATVVVAELFPRGSSAPTGSNTIPITLNNADAFHGVWTLPGGANVATSAGGIVWHGGPGSSFTLQAIPVLYSGLTISQVSLALENITGPTLICGGAVVDATLPFAATFGCAGVTDSVSLRVTASLYSNGNPGPTATTRIAVPPPQTTPLWANNASLVLTGTNIAARIDVAAPTGVAFTVVGTPNNWVNAAEVFSDAGGRVTLTRGTDAGVGLAASSTDVFEYWDLPSVTTVAFNPAAHGIPEDPVDFTNAAYSARVRIKDRLGNEAITNLGSTGVCVAVASPTGTSNSCAFGVDVTPPTVEYAGGLSGAANMLLAVSPAADSILNDLVATPTGLTSGNARFGARYRDTRSGFDVVTGGIFRRILRLGLSGSANALTGAVSACGGTNFTQDTGRVGTDDPTYRRDSVRVYGNLSATTPGVYTYTTCARDRAGNQSVVVTKRAAIDIAAPQITGIGIPANLVGGQPVAFTPTGLDDQEISQGGLYLRFPNLAVAPSTTGRLYFPPFTPGTTWPATHGAGTPNFWYEDPGPRAGAFNSTLCSPVGPGATCGGAPKLTAPIGFLLGIDLVQAGDSAPPPTVSATYKPDQVGAIVFDIKRIGTFAAATPDSSPILLAPLLPSLIAPGTPFSAIGVGKWFIFGAGTPAGSVAQARAMTSTSVTNPPFPQVAFFRFDPNGPPATGRWVWIGTVTANAPTNPTIFDQGSDRFWTYTLSGISPALAGTDVIIAVGMSSTGNGLATRPYTVP